MSTYNLGQAVELDYSTSPAETGTITVTRPDGTVAAAVLGGTVGAQTALVTADQLGVWTYLWTSTNAGQTPGEFVVGSLVALLPEQAAGYAPTPDMVHSLIALRPVFTDTSKPSRADVALLIAMRTDDVLGELDALAVPANLFGLARRTIALGAAADVESSFFPEQSGYADSQYSTLMSRYLAALKRFQELLARQGGGATTARTSRMVSPTIRALQDEQAGRSPLVFNPTYFPVWY